jgi:flagellin-like hook-associated protein FlgL
MFGSWMENEDLKSRFKEANFYTVKGVDRILQSVISERSLMGSIINTLEYKNRGLAVENENTQSFMSQGDTDFAVELSNLKNREILFFSNLFLLKQL